MRGVMSKFPIVEPVRHAQYVYRCFDAVVLLSRWVHWSRTMISLPNLLTDNAGWSAGMFYAFWISIISSIEKQYEVRNSISPNALVWPSKLSHNCNQKIHHLSFLATYLGAQSRTWCVGFPVQIFADQKPTGVPATSRRSSHKNTWYKCVALSWEWYAPVAAKDPQGVAFAVRQFWSRIQKRTKQRIHFCSTISM